MAQSADFGQEASAGPSSPRSLGVRIGQAVAGPEHASPSRYSIASSEGIGGMAEALSWPVPPPRGGPLWEEDEDEGYGDGHRNENVKGHTLPERRKEPAVEQAKAKLADAFGVADLVMAGKPAVTTKPKSEVKQQLRKIGRIIPPIAPTITAPLPAPVFSIDAIRSAPRARADSNSIASAHREFAEVRGEIFPPFPIQPVHAEPQTPMISDTFEADIFASADHESVAETFGIATTTDVITTPTVMHSRRLPCMHERRPSLQAALKLSQGELEEAIPSRLRNSIRRPGRPAAEVSKRRAIFLQDIHDLVAERTEDPIDERTEDPIDERSDGILPGSSQAKPDTIGHTVA